MVQIISKAMREIDKRQNGARTHNEVRIKCNVQWKG